MSMTYTTTEAARGRDADWERRHGPSAADVTAVWDFDGGRSLELTVGELEEYEQAEGVTLDEDIIGPQRFASLLEWLRVEERLEQPIHGSPVTDEEMAHENARLASAAAGHTPGPWSVGGEYCNSSDEIEAADGRGVAVVWTRRPNVPGATARPCWKDVPELRANARLIAAAPELLLACRALEQAVDLWFNEGSRASGVLRDLRKTLVDDTMMQTRAAIAKATGGAQ